MRLKRNVVRVTAFALVGVLGVAGFIAINNNTLGETTAIAGSWGAFVNTSWMNENDARYGNYTETPGSSESSPYLIKTAEEFSGIRAFESGSALAGKYLMLANDIDLSAHYWDPIELYGYGDPEDDVWNDEYDDELDVAKVSETVHFDGNNMKISGMNIENMYDAVFAAGYDDDYRAGATGLFSYTYKASISDVRLENSVMNLTETSGVPTYGDNYYYDEVPVSDLMGAVVGVAQNSQIIGVHVTDFALNYTAAFGDFVTDSCYTADSISAVAAAATISGCDVYFSPEQIVAGGAIGLSFGETLVSETSVRGGVVNVAPQVDETIGWGMDVLHGGGTVAVAGLVGMNMQSTILSTCSSADVVFSDDGYVVEEDENGGGIGLYSLSSGPEIEQYAAIEDRPLDGYAMFFGGLVGFSTTESYGGGASPSSNSAPKCIYNSCSHSELNIDAEISGMTAVGGVVGYAVPQERIMNNYYDGEVATSADNIFGEIIGAFWQDDYDDSAVRSNYYMDRGNDAIGMTNDDLTYSGVAPITTAEALMAGLNTGRTYVMGDLASNTNLTWAQISQMTTEWAVQDGAFPLACAGVVGLMFPDNRIGVPATGAK